MESHHVRPPTPEVHSLTSVRKVTKTKTGGIAKAHAQCCELTFCKKLLSLQLFWEKRLEGLRACDLDGLEFNAMELPRALRAVGPHVGEETLLQSVATALHVSTQPVTGQTGSRSALEKNPGVFLNPDQPLVQVSL